MERLWLHKISAPGWSKKFCTEIELVEELRQWICDKCITNDFMDSDDHVIDYNDLDDLLWTACGCEFMADNER